MTWKRMIPVGAMLILVAGCTGSSTRPLVRSSPVGDLVGNRAFETEALSSWDTSRTVRFGGGVEPPTTVVGHRGPVRFLFAGHTALGRLGILVGKDSTGSERLVVVIDDSAQRGDGELNTLRLEDDRPAPLPSAISAIAVAHGVLSGSGRSIDVVVVGGWNEPPAQVRVSQVTTKILVARPGLTEVTGDVAPSSAPPMKPEISIAGVSTEHILVINAAACFICA